MTLLLEDFKLSKYSIDLGLTNTQTKEFVSLNNSNTKNIKPYSNLIIETNNIDIKSFISKSGYSHPLYSNLTNSNNTIQSIKLTFNDPIRSIIPNNYVWNKIIVMFQQTNPNPEYFPIMIKLSQNISGATVTIKTQKPYLINNGLWCQEFNMKYVSTNSHIIQNDISIEINNSNAPELMTTFNIFKIIGETNYKTPLAFHPLTNVQTKDGVIHIRDLKIGDLVCDHENKYVRVNNILKSRVDTYVNISKGSINNNLPDNDLLVTPDQIVNINNKSLRAFNLVNHNNITLINNVDDIYGISMNTTDNTFIKCNKIMSKL